MNMPSHARGMAMFVLWVLRQWGQRLNADLYAMLAVGLVAVLESVFNSKNSNNKNNNKPVEDEL